MNLYLRRLPLLFGLGCGLGCLMEYTMIKSGYYHNEQKRQLQVIQELKEARKRLYARNEP